MTSFPGLSFLGRLCGSGRSKVVYSGKAKRHPGSVKRMSIIEDGAISEVLYLIPKRSMLRQMPYLNPADYYLCEGAVDEMVAHPQDPSHAAEKPLIQCHKCGDPCKGEVLRVQAKHFHIKCFTCKVCGCDLAQGGFFIKNGDYLCTLDYQRMYGTRCNGCAEFVEGEVVTALGKTYHPNCFACTVCKHPFPPGDRVTFNGRDCLCQNCAVQPMSPKELIASGCCAGCGRDIKNGQALLALEKQWHLGCFKCKACGKVLSGEYISKDGAPYCEKDYQVLFGVKCEACHQFITGKVLEAGDKHYHPSCARCSRCNQMFTEGEEMYLQGSTVWHPDCKQTSKAEEKLRPTRTSCESVYSRPGSSIPGSPGHTIYAKVDNEILDYKDLAAIPKVKAIYDIERPDLITYEPFYTTTFEDRQERQSIGELQSPRSDRSSTHNDRAQRSRFDFSPVHDETSPRTLSPTPSAEGYPDVRDRVLHRSTSQGSIGSPVYSRHNYTPTVSRSPQHFHRPGARGIAGEVRGPGHSLQPGDWILLKSFDRASCLAPRWRGPYQVLLVTQTAVRVGGRRHWIHGSHTKRIPHPVPYDTEDAEPLSDIETNIPETADGGKRVSEAVPEVVRPDKTAILPPCSPTALFEDHPSSDPTSVHSPPPVGSDDILSADSFAPETVKYNLRPRR
ncbi:actin-binding LIM protein 1 isoform X14 [Ambystoma mexicanum]|uniref:actin-binding LIM protein 1 isoform X14 n=1 Tax=Ambystoma mexicanum TaxID=8296 RepID=UPI0037E7DC18